VSWLQVTSEYFYVSVTISYDKSTIPADASWN
jgi:hypothetical protein